MKKITTKKTNTQKVTEFLEKQKPNTLVDVEMMAKATRLSKKEVRYALLCLERRMENRVVSKEIKVYRLLK